MGYYTMPPDTVRPVRSKKSDICSHTGEDLREAFRREAGIDIGAS